jgi:hypothetical protein
MRVIMDQAFAVGIRKRRPLLAEIILVMFAGIMPAAAQSDLCKQGYLWRGAFADDHVCVTPDARAQAAADNAAAAERRAPGGGDNCIRGYVWREANALDHVCVTPTTRQQTRSDNAASTSRLASSPPAARPPGRFADTPVGRALHEHLRILTDVSADADARKARSLAELRKNAKEASDNLMKAYREAPKQEYFGRWLLTLTLAELKSPEAYPALREIATSQIRLDSDDPQEHERRYESAIRQSAVMGLAYLAQSGNTAAEVDLLNIAFNPPSGDGAARVMAIKGYLSAGRDYDARVRTLMAQLPAEYQDVVTLTVSKPEPLPVPVQRHSAQPAAPHALPPSSR